MLLKDKKNIAMQWLLPIVCIWAAVFSVGAIALYLPGIYYDAVYPDYLAAIGAFPGIDNFTQITKHTGLPLLGNYYHGTMTAGVQYIILKCFGHANQLTLRLTNLAYFAAAGSLVYAIGYKIGKTVVVPLIGALLCVTASNVLLIPRTQYFIMLPGCIFFLCSFLLLCTDADIADGIRPKKILIAGVLQGLAFYGYFTYLFFTPASIILIGVFFKGTLRQKIKREIVFLWGILIGSIGYFIGYYDSLITNIFGKSILTHVLLWGGIVCVVIYLSIPIYLVWRHGDSEELGIGMKIFVGVSVAAVLAACLAGGIVLFLYRDKFQSAFNLLAFSQERTTGNRFLTFWRMLYMLVSGESAQDLMFGELLDEGFGIYFYLGIVMSAATAVAAILDKKKDKVEDCALKYIGAGYLYLAVYYVFTLPIAPGMQPQHFVVVYFLVFVLTILDTLYIGRHMPKLLNITAGVIIVVVGVSFNIVNDMTILRMLEQTEGRGRYSAALDEFAREAYLDEEKENKVYVFPQWGVYANFVYLTENTCEAVRDTDIEYKMLRDRLESGDTIVIAAFDKESIEDVVENLEPAFYEWHDMESKEGDYVFSYITVK